MSKIIEVKSCRECPARINTDCIKMDFRKIEYQPGETQPSWCPLPDDETEALKARITELEQATNEGKE